MVPDSTRFDGQTGHEQRHGGGFDATHPVATPVGRESRRYHLGSIDTNLHVVPILLIDGAIPLDATAQPGRLPAELIVGKVVGPVVQGSNPATVRARLRLPGKGTRIQR